MTIARILVIILLKKENGKFFNIVSSLFVYGEVLLYVIAYIAV